MTATTEAPAEIPAHPTDTLIRLIVNLLAPLFLEPAGSDLHLARLAALETLNAYRVETQADLLTVAQIIAFGLAALGSLSLSMSDDLPVTLVLRLRANANALVRSEAALRRHRQQDQARRRQEPAPDPQRDAATGVAVAETEALVGEARAKLHRAGAAADPKASQRAQWASACAEVARECLTDLPNLPPAERQEARIQAAALSDAARDMLRQNP